MRRTLFASTAALVGALFGVVLAAGPAWAQAGSIRGPGRHGQRRHPAALRRERTVSDAGTTQVQLFFPEGVPITLVDLPAVARWTTTVRRGGHRIARDERHVVTADRLARREPVAPADVGPVPTDPVRLQFKALQTYSNGEIDRWIEDSPTGAPNRTTRRPCSRLSPAAPALRRRAPARKRRRRRSRRPRHRRPSRRPSRGHRGEPGRRERRQQQRGAIVGIIVVVVGPPPRRAS